MVVVRPTGRALARAAAHWDVRTAHDPAAEKHGMSMVTYITYVKCKQASSKVCRHHVVC
jgi:hypothetical protein